MKKAYYIYIIFLLILSGSCSKGENPDNNEGLSLVNIAIDDQSNKETFANINSNLTVHLTFSENIDSTTTKYITLKDTTNDYIDLNYQVSGSQVTVRSDANLSSYSSYKLTLGSGLKSITGDALSDPKTYNLTTSLDTLDKYPRISDTDLLTLVQKQTFKYFWDFGHPTSGMARERSSSGNIVTTGGTGFGIMSIIVGIKRNFITREEGLTRVRKIADFLSEKCTRYHGAFSHWINGESGETIKFSTYDDGADIVETSFLFEGLLVARQYFDKETEEESSLRSLIARLWEGVEWSWFQQDNQNVLYWHWSPNYAWQMNMQINGWDEALITYILAAASPTYSISKEVYENGWAGKGSIINGSSYYGYTLPLGSAYGGPLFYSHYSFLGLNPNGLSDQYADYWEQNTHHALINYQYCINNPKGYEYYGKNCWGLTASDGNNGYSAYSPTNDQGVIAPTAALSSMPYTYEQSMEALRFFYYKLGDKIWSDYGFTDAFNLDQRWFDDEYLAIDQGPIIIMIENYRTGLIWNLFMQIDDIKQGLKKLGFQSSNYNK
ncbi:MAG: Ig-like domain-containing protein [Bacteroides sp.]|jgi:hypothetical protein|nr:Ig-like domain-containing protein [Bacteroides sp.]MCI1681313.1 Ig-like domain-containing protein [Bacteroides sp.]